MRNVISVSQLNRYIKDIIDAEEILKNIYIVGEISNFVHYFRSGHMYFTLKDEQSQLKAVMFKSYAQRLKFEPDSGMRVICRGRISAYEKDGVYQLYVEDMQPDGVGALNLAYEQLKEKLEKEGLFSNLYKKAIPKYPKKIGVATSNMGAAVEDIKNITKRRYPLCELVIVPTLVQGDGASEDIVKSIKFLDSMGDIDLIIVGRGGGSIEDLWAFNAESVARAVFACNTPVISAVGHETDFTICDFVADLRAPTPSAAAELAVPDIKNLSDFVTNAENSLEKLLKQRLENAYQHFDDLVNNSVLASAEDYYSSYADDIKSIKSDLITAFSQKVYENNIKVAKLAGKLDSLSPLAVMGRGYSVSKDSKGKVVKSIKMIKKNDILEVDFSDGKVHCTVDEVIYE